MLKGVGDIIGLVSDYTGRGHKSGNKRAHAGVCLHNSPCSYQLWLLRLSSADQRGGCRPSQVRRRAGVYTPAFVAMATGGRRSSHASASGLFVLVEIKTESRIW